MDTRLTRVEDKVDKLKDNMNDLKIHVKFIENKLDKHLDIVEEHIAGDKKIINHLEPIIHKFPLMIEVLEEYAFNKKLQETNTLKLEQRNKKLKLFGSILAVITASIGIFTTLFR